MIFTEIKVNYTQCFPSSFSQSCTGHHDPFSEQMEVRSTDRTANAGTIKFTKRQMQSKIRFLTKKQAN
jgi:hypothetical protein